MNEVKISRNAPCPCGSGKKYKLCCGARAVAAERLKEAQRNPNWVPDGVSVEKDETRGAWMNQHPKWVMRLTLDKDGSAENDANKVLDGLLRPFHERFCAEDLTRYGKGDQFDVVILQNTQFHDEKAVGQCPSSVLARYCEIWQVYRKKLVEFFTYFSDSDYRCEVRFDQGCGGPILTLTNDEGDMEMFYMGIPSRYEVDAP